MMVGTEVKRLPRILLAEDQDYTLKAIATFLEERYRERYAVVGVVKDGTTLVSETVKLAPDVAVVDLSMPGLNGLDATAALKKKNCVTKIVILTMNWEPEFLRAAFAAGAIGYVLKHRMVSDLPRAIEAALRGERFISPPLEPRPA